MPPRHVPPFKSPPRADSSYKGDYITVETYSAAELEEKRRKHQQKLQNEREQNIQRSIAAKRKQMEQNEEQQQQTEDFLVVTAPDASLRPTSQNEQDEAEEGNPLSATELLLKDLIEDSRHQQNAAAALPSPAPKPKSHQHIEQSSSATLFSSTQLNKRQDRGENQQKEAAAKSAQSENKSTSSQLGSPKSLWLALVLKNPFFYAHRQRCNKSRPHIPPPGSLKGYSADAALMHKNETAAQAQHQMMKKKKKTKRVESEALPAEYLDEETLKYIQNETTFLEDDDFLKKPNFLLKKDLDAPNDFQKMIELLLRLKKRQLHVIPSDIVEECEFPDPEEPWNFLDGYRLNESKLQLSPDGDEAYFRIHASRKTLTGFAEKQSLTLRSNPYSFAGGVGMVYDERLDKELQQSVRDYLKHFQMPEQDYWCRGKDDQGFGFCVEVPQKMRLLIRLLREGWIFGGCGLQLDEMKELNVLVVSYFPLHNPSYLAAYEIDKWASFSAMLDPKLVLKDNELALIHYFGESVAIYFTWMRQYVLYLIFPAAFGVICGILMEIEGLAPATIGGIFSLVMVLYMCSWIRKWERAEGRFSHRWGQDIEERQEMVRDRFVYERKNIVDVNTIFSMQFEFPLTMHRMSDGTMVELHFPHKRRIIRRYLVSYPIILLVASVMIVALYYTQSLRFEHAGDLKYSIASSILSVTISLVFGKIFSILVQFLNLYENARTESENENELILKSFVFYFISTYFAAFAIVLWPENGVDRSTRLFELRSQLIIQLAVMPAVQNVVEIATPRFGSIFRKTVDEMGGICQAILHLFCCCCPWAPVKGDYDGNNKLAFLGIDAGPHYVQKTSNNNNTKKMMNALPANITQQKLDSSHHQQDVDYFGLTNEEIAKKKQEQMEREKEEAMQTYKPREFKEGTIEHTFWTESQMEPYNTTADDFLEITLQYGWIVMFAAAFPWGSVLAIFYNIIEIRIDAIKLIQFCQRPIAKVSASIGAWLPILFFLNILSIITNSYFVIFVSDAPAELGLDTSSESLLRYFIYSQYFFFIFSALIMVVRGSTSPTAKKAQVKRDLLRDRAVQNFVTRSLSYDEKELQKQTEDRLKRFASLFGEGGGGNEDSNQICTMETCMNILLPSFCIPDGDDDDANGPMMDMTGTNNMETTSHQENINNNGSFSLRNDNNNNNIRRSPPQQTSSGSFNNNLSFSSTSVLASPRNVGMAVAAADEKQKQNEREAALLALSWARLNRREELFQKQLDKSRSVHASSLPNSAAPANVGRTSQQQDGGGNYVGVSSSSAMRMLPGETEDDFVNRIIQRDRPRATATATDNYHSPPSAFPSTTTRKQNPFAESSQFDDL